MGSVKIGLAVVVTAVISLVVGWLAFGHDVNVEVPNTSGSLGRTVNTTVVDTVVDTDLPKIMTDSLICVKIGSADYDPTIYNMRYLGWDWEFVNGVWYLNNERVGTAVNEDDSFESCAAPYISNTIEMFQNDILAAGGQVG